VIGALLVANTHYCGAAGPLATATKRNVRKLFAFGDAPFLGSGVGIGLGQVVDVAARGGPTLQAIADIPAIRHAQVSALAGEPTSARVRSFAGPK
jgi:hypothetical protein